MWVDGAGRLGGRRCRVQGRQGVVSGRRVRPVHVPAGSASTTPWPPVVTQPFTSDGRQPGQPGTPEAPRPRGAASPCRSPPEFPTPADPSTQGSPSCSTSRGTRSFVVVLPRSGQE